MCEKPSASHAALTPTRTLARSSGPGTEPPALSAVWGWAGRGVAGRGVLAFRGGVGVVVADDGALDEHRGAGRHRDGCAGVSSNLAERGV